MNLHGRVALITGAALRVGRILSLELARRGATVLIHYRDSAAEAKELSDEMRRRFGSRPELYQADLSKPAQVRRLASRVLHRHAALHILVHNASVYAVREFGSVRDADWDRHLDVNLKAPFFLSQALAKALEAAEGHILHIADSAALRLYPRPTHIPYCISKAGLLCLNAALAKALAPRVRVNAILPGAVLPRPESAPEERAAQEKATLLKRLGSPRDVARAALFLLESPFITGAALPVDGGRSIA